MSQFYGNVPYTPQQPLDSPTNVSNSTLSQQSLPTNVQTNGMWFHHKLGLGLKVIQTF